MEIRANMLADCSSTVTKNCVGPLVPGPVSAKYSFLRAVMPPASRRTYASLACPGSGGDAPPPSAGGSSAPANGYDIRQFLCRVQGAGRPGAESGLLEVRGLPGCRTGHNELRPARRGQFDGPQLHCSEPGCRPVRPTSLSALIHLQGCASGSRRQRILDIGLPVPEYQAEK
jgi:hypothetical protein